MPLQTVKPYPPAGVGVVEPSAPAARLAVPTRPSPARPDGPLLIELFRCCDVAVAVLSLLAVLALARGEGVEAVLEARMRVAAVGAVGAFVAWWSAIFALLGLYAVPRADEEATAVVVAAGLGSAALIPYVAVAGGEGLGWEAVLWLWAVAAAGTVVERRLLRAAWRWARRGRPRRVLVVGSGPRGRGLVQALHADARGGVRVVGVVDREVAAPRAGVPYLGGLERLESVLVETAVDEVLIALPVRSCYAEAQAAIGVCERLGVTAGFPADTFTAAAEPRLAATSAGPLVSLSAAGWDERRRVKRVLDLAGSAAGLLLLAPLLLLLAAVVRCSGPGPVLFVQQRYGHNRRRFRMFKFRTMVCDAEARQAELEHLNEASGPVFKIRDDPRVTRVGRVLRRTSLDELPQLFNVLRGEMSLVGPRPLPPRDVQRLADPATLRRFSVRPGMTGLWQVSGRSELEFDTWVALDLDYIDRWSLGLDLRILARTIPAVVRGRGAA
jgi:exopolysaccharide biosynthesis polyprenyl glycosylphosphotransferase